MDDTTASSRPLLDESEDKGSLNESQDSVNKETTSPSPQPANDVAIDVDEKESSDEKNVEVVVKDPALPEETKAGNDDPGDDDTDSGIYSKKTTLVKPEKKSYPADTEETNPSSKRSKCGRGPRGFHKLPQVFKRAPEDKAPRPPKAFDFNHFATKKTVGMVLLDVCLIATQCSQLKAVIQTDSNEFAGFLIFFLVVSLLLQVGLAVTLGLVGRTNINIEDDAKRRFIDRINNVSLLLILLITVVIIICSTFGINNGRPLAKSAATATTTAAAPPTASGSSN